MSLDSFLHCIPLCGSFLMIHCSDSTSAEKGKDLLKVLINCTFIHRFAHFTNIFKKCILSRNCVHGTGETDKAQPVSSRSCQVKQIFAILHEKSIKVLQRGRWLSDQLCLWEVEGEGRAAQRDLGARHFLSVEKAEWEQHVQRQGNMKC